ncbi:hypothetical protein TanjilG_31794 [Lupinus angustifolius]|uniref:Pectinesterase inhibitor domain-containing protein n=1 Tax=Lupinus angustifolius TaxID=3871 RepID=A0A4P1RMQ2_LUPAN|nr:hypothetical protein TanjilG_31794 [Lupinus angustifolius]
MGFTKNILLIVSISSFLLLQINATRVPSPLQDGVTKLCSTTTDPVLCVNTILPHLHGDFNPYKALELEIIAAKNQVVKSVAVMDNLIRNPSTTKETKESLIICKDQYGFMIDSINQAIAAVSIPNAREANAKFSEVSNQMLELYEQNKVSQFQGSEVEGSTGGGTQAAAKAPSADEEQTSARSAAKHTSAENQEVPLRGMENQINDGSAEMGSGITDHKVDLEIRDSQNPEQLPKDNKGEVTLRSNSATEQIGTGDQGHRECLLRYSPKDAIKMIDKDKVKAALKKRRKERGEKKLKKDVMDEDDLIERELEDGIELAVENEKNKEGRQSWSEPDDADNDKDHADAEDVKRVNMKGQLLTNVDADNEREGEMIDNASSPLNNRKRKKGSPLAAQPELKRLLDSSHYNNHAE